jgi:hypothetical protein
MHVTDRSANREQDRLILLVLYPLLWYVLFGACISPIQLLGHDQNPQAKGIKQSYTTVPSI